MTRGMSRGAQGGRLRRRAAPRTRAEMQRDRETVAPLFAYLAEHCVVPMWAARRAAMRVGVATLTRTELYYIKAGRKRIPDWLIEGVCREIGQPVEVVMGQEWAQRHLPAVLSVEQVEQVEQKAS